MRAFARRDPTDSMPAALRVTGLGHEDAFPQPRLSARYRFSQGTFAGTRATGETRRYQPFAEPLSNCGSRP
jgi:hypothetical protein